MVDALSFQTLAFIAAPTLRDGLVQLLRLGDALQSAGQDCGVSVYHDEDGRLLEAVPDYELPAGVVEYVRRHQVEPWPADELQSTDQLADAAARRELLELLAHVTHGDIIASCQGVQLL